MTARTTHQPAWDEQHQVSVYQPTGWALTVTQEQSGPDRGRWMPCLVLWLTAGHLTALMDLVGVPALGVEAPNRRDRFAPAVVEPEEYVVLDPPPGDQPPVIRCYLPSSERVDEVHLDSPEGPAAAIDVPAPAALTAALANHNDTHGWNLPILVAAGRPLPMGTPLPPRSAALSLAVDLEPLAEDIGGSEWFPPSLLMAPLAESAAHGHGHGDGRTVGEIMASSAQMTWWSILGGVAIGHEVSARRLNDLAEDFDAVMATLGEEQEAFETTQDAVAALIAAASISPAVVPLVAFWQVAVSWHAHLRQGDMLPPSPSEPIFQDLGMTQEAASLDAGALGHVFRSGVFGQTLDPVAWQQVAMNPAYTENSTCSLGTMLRTLIVQTAVRIADVESNPVGFLAGVIGETVGDDPAWPLMALAQDLVAHDTLRLRALLGDAEDHRFDPGYLHGLLHSIQHVLDVEPSVEEYVRTMATVNPSPTRARAVELLNLIAVEDPCGLYGDTDYAVLADQACTLLPLLADALAATVTPDEGSEQWVQAREDALHALLHVPLDWTDAR